MARAALPGRLTWQLVSVVELVEESSRAKSLVLAKPDWPGGYRSGQHVDVRLTAEDGYQAQRSYSIGSAPEDEHLILTVERLDDGEVSPYLVDVLRPGDELELRGPIGGYFVWEEALGGPLVLVAGGSGVVPLRSMLRHWATTNREIPVSLVYSSRRLSEVIYHDELLGYGALDRVDVRFVLTREWPDDWQGHRGRIDRNLIDGVAGAPDEHSRIYICGPNAFVETAAGWLAEGGRDPGRIRTERFGPTGT
ncbi:MAG TPA: ferredoxin reductase [Solirubrobacteraceae bacterium]|nr:ferredoxin reductase [Solirubrobacteraceae bacterium]